MHAPQHLLEHPMYTASDYQYLHDKGYDDAEIEAFWDRDRALGKPPLVHQPIPDIVSYFYPLDDLDQHLA